MFSRTITCQPHSAKTNRSQANTREWFLNYLGNDKSGKKIMGNYCIILRVMVLANPAIELGNILGLHHNNATWETSGNSTPPLMFPLISRFLRQTTARVSYLPGSQFITDNPGVRYKHYNHPPTRPNTTPLKKNQIISQPHPYST